MALGTFIGGLTGLFGARQQIDAQRKENQETREYNLSLARLQNRWNVEQWHRENAYNSPAAQMSRFAAAGLNPNLIYGQTNTAPQLSGSMSSGAPASPTDLSAMGKSTEAMSKLFGSFGDALMQLPMYREQLRGIRLQNDEKQLDIYAKEHEKSVRDWLGRIFSDGEVPTDGEVVEMQDSLLSAHQIKALNEIRLQSEQLKKSRGDNRLFERNFDNIVREVANKADISRSDAEYYAKTLFGRIAAANQENKLKSLDDLPEWGQKGARILQIIADIVGRIIKLR